VDLLPGRFDQIPQEGSFVVGKVHGAHQLAGATPDVKPCGG